MKPLIMVIVLAGIGMSVFNKSICKKIAIAKQVRKIKPLISAKADSQLLRHAIFFKEIW